jgi:hypothetical protein
MLVFCPGTRMYIADTLSRAYIDGPAITECTDDVAALANMQQRERLRMVASQATIYLIKRAATEDDQYQQLRTQIATGWPDARDDNPPALREFATFADEFTKCDGLVFKGQRVVTPAAARADILQPPYSSHQGLNATIRTARESVFYVRLTADLKRVTNSCSICQAYQMSMQEKPNDASRRTESTTGESRGEHFQLQTALLVRPVMEMTKRLHNTTLKDYLCPAQFKNVAQAVRSVTGYCEETGQYKTPRSALKLGHLLKKCAKIVKSDATKKNRSEIEDADYFYQLCETEWADELSSKALNTVITRQRNKVQLLPLSEDVSTLHKFLSIEIKRWTSALETGINAEKQELDRAWRKLASATSCQLITFNRRRAGEVSRMKVHDFNLRTKSDMSDHAQKALKSMEGSLCRPFTRVEIECK